MQIHLTGRHCDFEPSLQQLTQQKMDKLQKFARDILEAQVVLTREKTSRHVAEITLRLKSQNLVSTETANDASEAITLAADRLEHSLRRLKDKRVDRRRTEGLRGLNGREAAAEPVEDDLE